MLRSGAGRGGKGRKGGKGRGPWGIRAGKKHRSQQRSRPARFRSSHGTAKCRVGCTFEDLVQLLCLIVSFLFLPANLFYLILMRNEKNILDDDLPDEYAQSSLQRVSRGRLCPLLRCSTKYSRYFCTPGPTFPALSSLLISSCLQPIAGKFHERPMHAYSLLS